MNAGGYISRVLTCIFSAQSINTSKILFVIKLGYKMSLTSRTDDITLRSVLFSNR